MTATPSHMQARTSLRFLAPLPLTVVLVLALVPALVLALVLASRGATAQSPQTFTLSGKVTGASGHHTVYIALWDSAGFLTKQIQGVKIAPGASPEFHFQVPPGQWAISAYEDINENAKLDMGMLGPKEPSGFWRPFHKWRKPVFADVASTINRDIPSADIQLQH